MTPFEQFVRDVVADFRVNTPRYLSTARAALPEVSVTRVSLGGSYGRGVPREDSDIDMAVHYSGDLDPAEVLDRLGGRFHGYGGVFDIHPMRDA